MHQVYLPLRSLDCCSTCRGKESLRLCSQCAERIYCSQACQKRDWETHKTSCKTDRIDLSSFYPLLACLIESSRLRISGRHVALQHQIVNAPNPYTAASDLPDGTAARVVKLGSPVSLQDWHADFSGWWPLGATAKIRGKLLRRITREGNCLPLVMSTCLALLFSIYSTTTSENSTGHHRVRLRYRSSPISDFGVVAGAARVIPDDELAYILPDNTVQKGQDPKDHYWIYFRTIKGEEVTLDCNMFTFNMCTVVYTTPYITPRTSHIAHVAPAWFKDRNMTRNIPSDRPILMERRRFSVLRDDPLRAFVEHTHVLPDGEVSITNDTAANAIRGFMTRVADRPVSQSQLEVCIGSMIHGVNVVLDATIRSDAWKRFPEQPTMGIETDPGE